MRAIDCRHLNERIKVIAQRSVACVGNCCRRIIRHEYSTRGFEASNRSPVFTGQSSSNGWQPAAGNLSSKSVEKSDGSKSVGKSVKKPDIGASVKWNLRDTVKRGRHWLTKERQSFVDWCNRLTAYIKSANFVKRFSSFSVYQLLNNMLGEEIRYSATINIYVKL